MSKPVAARGGARPGDHLQGQHFEPLQPNGEHTYSVIITKIAVTSFSPKITKCRLAAGLRPDPLTSLSAPADSLAVAGRRCRNKVEEKGGMQGKKGKGKLRTHDVFKSISIARSPAQPPICVANAPLATGVNVGSVIDHPTRPAGIPVPVAYPYDYH